MTKFKSNPADIRQTADHIYQFLTDFHNFEKLLPEQVINWEATAEQCSFTIKGMADLALIMGQNQPGSKVVYQSVKPSPFDFSLMFDLLANENITTVQCLLSAKLNPMLKMMASRPLQNFVNLLVEKLKEIMEQEA